MKVKYLLLLVVLNVFWSATYCIYKTLEPYDLNPAGIVSLRFGMAALCFLLLWPWLPGAAPRGRDLFKSVLIGLLVFVLAQRLQVWGNKLGSAGNSAVLMAFEPLLTSVGAALFLREHIGPRRKLGVLAGLLGVALLNGVWRPEFHLAGLLPSLMLIASFCCETAYSIIGKPVLARASEAKITAVALFGGATLNFALDGGPTLEVAKTLPPVAWLYIAYLAVLCTVVGYTGWLIVIKHTEVNLAALTIFVQPVVGVALAAVWVREPLHWGQLWGSLAILAGLVYGFSRQVGADKGT